MKRGKTVCPGSMTCSGAGFQPFSAIISRTVSAREANASAPGWAAASGSRSATAYPVRTGTGPFSENSARRILLAPASSARMRSVEKENTTAAL